MAGRSEPSPSAKRDRRRRLLRQRAPTESGTDFTAGFSVHRARASWRGGAVVVFGLALLVLSFLGPLREVIAEHLKIIAAGVGIALVSGGLVAVSSGRRNSSLVRVTPPDAQAANPARELGEFADRCAGRLRRAYHLQLGLAVAVALMLAAILVWSLAMVTMDRLKYGVALGSGSLAGTIISSAKWQPFDRVVSARRAADRGDVLALGLRQRLRTIDLIADPQARQQAQWEAVRDYTALS